jgi:hypothetical protein
LGVSNLEYETCVLADEEAMVHREQCLECTIAELVKEFDCIHMKPVKVFKSGGKSKELIECIRGREILDQGRSKCKHCTQKEETDI